MVLSPSLYEIMGDLEWPMRSIDYDILKKKRSKTRKFVLRLDLELDKHFRDTRTTPVAFYKFETKNPAAIGLDTALEQILTHFIQLAEELGILHNLGLHHGDVSLDNLIMGRESEGSRIGITFIYDPLIAKGSVQEDIKRFGILMWELIHMKRYSKLPVHLDDLVKLEFNDRMGLVGIHDIIMLCIHDKTFTTTKLINRLKNVYISEVIGRDNVHSIHFWKRCFTERPIEASPPYQVSWKKFEAALLIGAHKYYDNPQYILALKALLETKPTEGEGFVRCQDFAAFIGFFGDINPTLEWFQRIEWAIFHKWFFGKIDRAEANTSLKKSFEFFSHKFNPFLIRFYEKAPNMFTISYMTLDREVYKTTGEKKYNFTHHPISKVMKGGKEYIESSILKDFIFDKPLTIQNFFPGQIRRGDELYNITGVVDEVLEEFKIPDIKMWPAQGSYLYDHIARTPDFGSVYSTEPK